MAALISWSQKKTQKTFTEESWFKSKLLTSEKKDQKMFSCFIVVIVSSIICIRAVCSYSNQFCSCQCKTAQVCDKSWYHPIENTKVSFSFILKLNKAPLTKGLELFWRYHLWYFLGNQRPWISLIHINGLFSFASNTFYMVLGAQLGGGK